MKKTTFTLLFSFFIIICSFGQTERTFKFTIDYSPNFSKIADPLAPSLVKFSHNGFAKMEYPLSKNLAITAGLGFLNSGERNISELNGFSGINRFTFNRNYEYIVVPFGIKKHYGSLFINPEISVGVYINDYEYFTVELIDGSTTTEKRNTSLFGEINEVTAPIILTIGNEFNTGNLSFYAGIRAYYSIIETVPNTPGRNNNYYGLGLLLGIKL